jgi:hypothetical protein
MLLCDIPNFRSRIRQNLFLHTQLSNMPASPESCKQVAPRYLTLTCLTLTSPDLLYKYLSATSFRIFQYLLAYCALHTTDTFHGFVLFSFAFSSNNKLSTVSTDHYVCCYLNWTDIWHKEIVLLLKDVRKDLLTNELSSIPEKVLFHSGFQSAVQTVVKFLLKNEETCSKRNWVSNVCWYFLQSQSQLLV